MPEFGFTLWVENWHIECHHKNPFARGANRLKVKWASVGTDNASHLLLNDAVYTIVKLKTEKNVYGSYCFKLRSSDSNENIIPMSNPIKFLVYCVLYGQPNKVKIGNKREEVSL